MLVVEWSIMEENASDILINGGAGERGGRKSEKNKINEIKTLWSVSAVDFEVCKCSSNAEL
jgi:hypothetical protein